MKKLKQVTAAVLCFVMVLGMTACNVQSGGSDVPSITTTIDEFDASNSVDVDDITLDIADADIDGQVVRYLGCYDLTKAGDIKPAYVYFKNNYGATIEVETVSDADIMDKLGTYVSSGDSPDLVDKRTNTFPYWISKNIYQPIDEYMDLTAPQWTDVATYIESFAINGKHYYYPWAYYVNPNYLIYNRAKFEELGLDDPKTLYDNGNWTWDTYYNAMAEFVNKTKADTPDALGVYGAVATSFINSTGASLISFDGTQLNNNMRNTDVERAQAFVERVKKEGLANIIYADYTNVAAEPVIYGFAAFQCVGDWKISDYAKLQKHDESLDIFFVPIPRDPDADNYYLRMDTFGYMVPSGAKNVEAACVFMNCVRLSKTDGELYETTVASIKKSKAYTDEQYEFWAYFQNPANFDSSTLITDYAYGLDATTTTDVITPMLEDVALKPEADSWTTLREQFLGNVDSSVDALNQVLAS